MTDVLVDNPFENVQVYLGVAGGAEIKWWPKPDLPFPAPWKFKVEHADVYEGPWEKVTTVSDNILVLDPDRYKYDTLATSWYRVGLIDNKNNVHYSDPTHVGTVLSRRDWVIAKDACRRAHQRMRLKTGRPGWLLKRRHWGKLCPKCGNEITNQPANSDCATCYGTGVVDGYYDPAKFWVELDNPDVQAAFDAGPMGNRFRQKTRGLAVNFPVVEPMDIWVDGFSDRRWRIQEGIQIAASERGVPLTVSIPMEPIETTDVVYQFPINDNASGGGYASLFDGLYFTGGS